MAVTVPVEATVRVVPDLSAFVQPTIDELAVVLAGAMGIATPAYDLAVSLLERFWIVPRT